MQPILRFLLLGGFTFFAVTTASGQAPANDLFANAITINGPIATVTGSNVGATKQFGGGGGGEPSIGPGLGNFGGASVWWNWTAAASGQTTIDTDGSDFNTLLGAFTGDAQNALTLVAGNDNFEANTWSRITFNAVAGTTYRIMVDGFRSGPGFGAPATGNIRLNVKGVGGLDISLANGMVFTVGDPIPVSVSFTPDFPNPPATRVDFYRRGSPFTTPVLFASDDTAPFSAVAENVPAGSNTIYVAAFDSLGNPVESPAATVLVQNVGVTLLTPFEDTMYLNATSINVTAWGYLPAGSITNVEFLVDGVKFAESDTAPFSGAWTTITPGSHRFTAVGRSDTGARYVSQPVNVGVAATLMANGSVWKYLDDNSDQGTAWRAPDFNDASWLSGPAPLGYGDSSGRPPATTNVFGPDPNAKYITTYYRQAVTINNAAAFARINLNIERDDGAVVYLNGAELGRFNMPTGDVTSATFALNAGDDGVTISTIPVNPALLVDGVNVFAVEVHQDALNSSDIWFQMNLQGIPVIIHNLSPVVDLTAPAAGTYFLAPSEIALTATASDGDGSVAKVEFFADGVKIGEDAEAPYEAVWNNPPIALHILTAVATDDQGATTTSAEIPIVVYDAIGTPVGRITAPPDGHVVEGPTNMVVTATANATNSVANVRFLANGIEFASTAAAPYSAIWPAPFGTNVLTIVVTDATGSVGSSPPITVVVTVPPTNVIAPTVAAQTPLAGETLTNLTSIRVLFSERVLNVDASDLLINGVPAASMTSNGSLTNYVFSFPEPPYGTVNITWASGHGITDYGYPANLPFDENGPGATWSNNLIDKTLPRVAARTPAPGATVTNLTEISVSFSEAVSGVDAADLLVNGNPATAVSGSGIDYVFTLPGFGSGLLSVTWSTNNDIFDLALEPNAFNRAQATNNWSFTLDTRYIFIQTNSSWLFIKGLAEASDPTNAWRRLTYDDSGWSNAPAPFFYGETTLTNANYRGTTLSDMQSNYTSIYLRREFTVENRGNITNLLLFAQVDDGFVAWINGVQMVRFNAPAGEVRYNSVASAQSTEPNNNGAAWTVFQMPASAAALVDGRNVIAVHALNQNLTNSSDFSFNAQLYTYLIDPSTVGPRLLEPEPRQGDTFYLTNVLITFSEPVSGVDAADLLVNGTPAASVSSTTNTTYSFSFTQPPYGSVLVNWDTNHGILDFDGPPKPFNDASTNSTLRYFLINPSNPKVATQAPPGGSTVTGLTEVVVTFTEPVSGVEASDLLVAGTPAATVTSTDNVNYTFTFAQPPFGSVAIRWDTNHAIVDVEAGNAFDPTRLGGQWSYTLIDPVPSITLTSPTNNTFFLPLANITLRATATDNDGTVVLVEFYEGASKLSEGTNAPYSLALSNLDLGTYTFRAVATDNIGLSRTSAPAVINVVTSLPIALIRGPYLQSGSPTGAVVRWRTSAISDGLVYYGTDLNNLTNLAQETSVTNEHIVQLNGLEPDTQYFYSIGSAAYRLVGGTNDGANYWFKSSPVVGTRKPTRLWVLGDAGTAGNGAPDRQASTRDSFYKYSETNGGPADLWLMLGDNAYNVGSDAEHQAAVFDMYPTTLRNKFLWPTLGNHETSQSTTATDFPYLHIFSLPKAGEAGGVPSGTEKYYSFDYGNIHFVCLDSMTSGQTATTPMARWLENDLAATAQEWIIVFFHHPPYTKGSHNSDTEQDLVAIRQNLVPILETYGVDLVLSGHSHCYERSFLMDGHYGLSGTLTDSMKINGGDGREDGDGAYRKNDEGRGVVYTVAGSSGQATFLQGDAPLPAMHVTLLQLGSMVIDVSGNRLDAIFLRETGEVQDQFTITKPSPFPAAPLNLVALPSSANEINLAWIDTAGNELGFSVERSTDGINFNPVMAVAADATSALDTDVIANMTYFYRVRGTNNAGPGEYSNVASATTVLPTTTPAPPSNLVAASDDGVSFYRSQMFLSWQDRSSNEAAFQIERSLDGTSFVPVATVAANIISYVDRNLDSGTVYYYRVRSFNALGFSAASSLAGDTTHPQSQLALAGGSATFHAGVEGVAPVQYQWRFQGVPLVGETNEFLTIANAQSVHDGAYTVAVTNAAGSLVSNPAWLIVLVPPFIVEHPVSQTNIIGSSITFRAAAGGTAPLNYQWRKDGVNIPGASGPQFSFGPLTFASEGYYDVVVRNGYGSATSQAAWLEVTDNRPPMLATMPDRLIQVLRAVALTNLASDPDLTNQLTFALEPGAPTNATLHPTDGVFRWTPTREQAPSTNVITIRVDDNGIPNLSDTMSFTLIVNDYLEVLGGSTIMNAGETTNVTLGVVSTAEWTDLQYDLGFPGDRLSGLTVESLFPELVNTSFQLTDANTARITFTAVPGQILQGTQEVARLHFTALPGQESGFANLDIRSLGSTMTRAGVAPTLIMTDGRAVVLGSQGLLESRLSRAGQRQLVIYGQPGVAYTLQSRVNLNSGVWGNRITVTLTNTSQTVAAPSPNAAVIYYRLRQ